MSWASPWARARRGMTAPERRIDAALADDRTLHEQTQWLEDPAFRAELAVRLGDLLGLSTPSTLLLREVAGHSDEEVERAGGMLLPEEREAAADMVQELVPALRAHGIRPQLLGLDEQVAADCASALRQGQPLPALQPDFSRATASSDATELTRLVGLLPADMRQRIFHTGNRAAISIALTGLLGLLARGQQAERDEERQQQRHAAELERERREQAQMVSLRTPRELVLRLGEMVLLAAVAWLVFLLLAHLFGWSW